MAETNNHTRFLDPSVLGRISRLGLKAHRVMEGSISGLHRSPLHGVSPEFADHREYAPGDDLKNLDWRVFARSDRHYIKRFEEESNLRCTILLDCSASMGYASKGSAKRSPTPSKFEYAARVAACLAAMLMKQRDAVGLITMDTKVRDVLRPSATQSQLHKILSAIDAAEVRGETELGPVIREAGERIHRRGMVIVISDLLTDLDSLYNGLGRLQYSGHEILVFQVMDRDEIELPFRDSVIFRDLEPAGGGKPEELFAEPWAFRKQYQKAMDAFIKEVKRRCQFCGIDHELLLTDQDLGLTLSHYLHQRLQRSAGQAKHAGHMSHQHEGEPVAD